MMRFQAFAVAKRFPLKNRLDSYRTARKVVRGGRSKSVKA
jgi:hypothetical protein